MASKAKMWEDLHKELGLPYEDPSSDKPSFESFDGGDLLVLMKRLRMNAPKDFLKKNCSLPKSLGVPSLMNPEVGLAIWVMLAQRVLN